MRTAGQAHPVANSTYGCQHFSLVRGRTYQETGRCNDGHTSKSDTGSDHVSQILPHISHVSRCDKVVLTNENVYAERATPRRCKGVISETYI